MREGKRTLHGLHVYSKSSQQINNFCVTSNKQQQATSKLSENSFFNMSFQN